MGFRPQRGALMRDVVDKADMNRKYCAVQILLEHTLNCGELPQKGGGSL
jgi:hypothetical protein